MPERNINFKPESSTELLMQMVDDKQFGIKDLIKHFDTLETINPAEAYGLYRDFLPNLEQKVNQVAKDESLDKDYRVAMINLLATVQDKVRIGVEGGVVPPLKIEPQPTAVLKQPNTGKLKMSDVENLQNGGSENKNGNGNGNGKGVTTNL